MKVLLDENIDIRLKKFLEGFHEVYTVNDMHWNGIKNEELLKLIAEYKFDCWIVVDKNMHCQPNTAALPCAIIILDVYRNILKNLLPLIPEILKTLSGDVQNEIVILKTEA